MQLGDTIVAIATPVARAGLGVVRLSGPDSLGIAQRLIQDPQAWEPWTARFGQLIGKDGDTLDQVIATYFAKPKSYTAEDVVEISCHGSPVVLRACVDLSISYGARLAEPGEFTFRAFLNGRIDLMQAEAVRDLIDATTVYQARVAAQQVDGSLSRRIRPIKEQLVELIALLEAGIDFAEDDVSVAPAAEILLRLEPIQSAIAILIASFVSGKLIFQGFTLAIVGRPNVGKSSLFNRLLQQDRAIVTEIPGTTRDLVAESTSLRGVPLRLIDTAGIRAGEDIVERLGIEKSHQAMADADLVLLIFDTSVPETAEDVALREKLAQQSPILIGNKCDLPNRFGRADDLVEVSATTGDGFEGLQNAIFERLAPEGLASPESGAITSLRHESLLKESGEALQNARRAVDFAFPHEMLLIDLYAALSPIDAITGQTTADDILNRIFSTFCIGK